MQLLLILAASSKDRSSAETKMYFAVIVAGSLIFGSLIMANPQDSPLRCVGKDGADQVCLPNNEGEVAVCYFMHQSGYGQKEDQSWQGCMQYLSMIAMSRTAAPTDAS
ncbi:hypothetical protein L596_001471 [Steinernema carpocapsae]|uniref:Uncharacterized protein n=1 Tax=Steinernema carpocapsae TaxID=34508 RepID=A0A4U8ULC7_STECR|nr:hypothetical protein L596_001471 [Steinernema carpocapsae]